MAVVEQTALIAVPNDYTKKVLESDVREHLVATLSGALGRDIGLAVTVDPTLEHATPSSNGVDPANGFDTANGDERHESPDAARMERFHPEGSGRHTPGVIAFPRRDCDQDCSRLNPKYTFDTFVAG